MLPVRVTSSQPSFFILSIITSSSYAINFDKHLELSYVQTSGNSNTNTFSTKLEATTKLSEKSK